MRLLMISRDVLLQIGSDDALEPLYRKLAYLHRIGFNLLVTAAAPDKWLPTRGNVDSVLKYQSSIQESMQSAGGEFDGVYYVPRSLLTQDRNRTGALEDILKRYAVSAHQATLISDSEPFLKAAARMGIHTLWVSALNTGADDLLAQLKSIEGGP